VHVVIGTQRAARATRTSLAQVIADLLWVPRKRWRSGPAKPKCERRRRLAFRRSMRHAADGVSIAAKELIEKASQIASFLCEAKASFQGRRYFSDSEKSLWFELARAAEAALLPRTCAAASRSSPTTRCTRPSSRKLARLRVRGQIRDGARADSALHRGTTTSARCINPLIVHAQTHGADRPRAWSRRSGRLCHLDPTAASVAGSLMEYA